MDEPLQIMQECKMDDFKDNAIKRIILVLFVCLCEEKATEVDMQTIKQTIKTLDPKIEANLNTVQP